MDIDQLYSRVGTTRASTAKAIELYEVKDHLRIERGNVDEDELLAAMIDTVTNMVEEISGYALIKQHRVLYLDDWSTSDCIRLPYPPLISITSSTAISDSSGAAVSYKNSTKDWNELSSTSWIADTVSRPGRLCLEYGETWPTATLHNVNPIAIRYTCGFSTSSTGVPRGFKAAMKIMVSDLYENRESFMVARQNDIVSLEGKTLMTVKTLLALNRIWGV